MNRSGRRREAEEQRFNRLVAAFGSQTVQQGNVSGPTGKTVPVSPPTPVESTPIPKATVVPPPYYRRTLRCKLSRSGINSGKTTR